MALDVRKHQKKIGLGRSKKLRYMRYTPDEKYEIIRLVEGSELGVVCTLRRLGIHKSTFILGIIDT
jgi:transposase-like protein